MVQPVDTEAEIRLVLWLNGNADGNVDEYSAKYRKDGSGYVVKEHYVSNGDDVYGCGDFTYRYKISSAGKITQKKLLKKEKLPVGQIKMKQIKIILITLLLTLTAHAGWKPLKSLDHYGPKAFRLKTGVAYVEIRTYKEDIYAYASEISYKKK